MSVTIQTSGGVGNSITTPSGTNFTMTATDASFDVVVGTGAGDDFTINTTGFVYEGDNNRVGIGTAAPTNTFDVRSDDQIKAIFSGSFAGEQGIRVQRASGDWVDIRANFTGQGGGLVSSDALRFAVNAGVISTPDVIIETDGKMGIGTETPAAQLHIDQSSTTAASPVLYLDQADVSEEMIEFNTTIGTGNAIEAVGAKTLTVTHFVKVTIPGGLTRYLPVGTIA